MDDVPLLVDTGDEPEEPRGPAVPVTIVTGYLGSGKSTLLKNITSQETGKRIAIILNEFGDSADIEKSLTVTQENEEVEEWLELPNGCMCCTAKDAGVAAIESLMTRSGKFDYVILETSGIADPAPIANMFWLDDALQSGLRLDGVVTVVDAVNILRSLSEPHSVAGLQCACADILIVNKCDLVSAQDLEEVTKRIKELNRAARIITSEYSQVESSVLLDINAYNEADVSRIPQGHSHGHGDVTTICVRPLISVGEIERRLQSLLWENAVPDTEVLRVKGKLIEEDKTLIVQGVREVYDMIEVPKENGDSKLVLIGRFPSPDRIEKLLGSPQPF